MQTSDLVSQLNDEDAVVRERACESLEAGHDLSIVETLIRIVSEDASEAVRYDASQALTRLCFVRPIDCGEHNEGKWWAKWWNVNAKESPEELLSDCLARYLIYTYLRDDEALEEEITLGIALCLENSWSSMAFHRHMVNAMARTLLENHVEVDERVGFLSKRLLSFSRHLLDACNVGRRGKDDGRTEFVSDEEEVTGP